MSATPIASVLASWQRRRRLGRAARGALATAGLALLGSQATLAGDGQLLAGRAPISDAELAALRGGFVTEDGLEVTFGMRLKLDLDRDLQFIAEFRPAPARGKGRKHGHGKKSAFAPGEFRASFRRPGAKGGEDAVTTVERSADGTIAVSGGPDGGIELPGSPQVEVAGPPEVEMAGSPEVAIPGGTAEIENRADGFALNAKGEVPISLEQGPEGIVVVVGDSRTTLIEDRLGPEGFSAQLSNRRNGADIIHDALLDVDVHNFTELSALRKAGIQRRRLQSLVNRGLVDFATRR